ncbi:MAG: hypothetical protein QG610_2303, partial [Euryarchaeota archaeon]|nr:hypothetical protein [Euryarchaeota archaeon]
MVLRAATHPTEEVSPGGDICSAHVYGAGMALVAT